MFERYNGKIYRDSEGYAWVVMQTPEDVDGREEMIVKRWYEDEYRTAVLHTSHTASIYLKSGRVTLKDDDLMITEEATKKRRERAGEKDEDRETLCPSGQTARLSEAEVSRTVPRTQR
jgi:hypothetical protein